MAKPNPTQPANPPSSPESLINRAVNLPAPAAPPAAPAPAAPPAPVPPVAMPTGWTDPGADLDALAGNAPPAPTALPAPSEEDEEKEAASALEAEAAAAAAAHPPEPPAAPVPPAADGKPPSKVKALRDAYERLKTEKSDLEKKLNELATAAVTPEVARRIETLESEKKQLVDHLDFVAYQQGPTFKQQYSVPVESALKEGFQMMGELTVTDTATGQEIPAKPEDFISLVRMDRKKAAAKATEWFGPAAADVIRVRSTYINAVSARDNALATYKDNQTKLQAEQAQNAEIARQRSAHQWTAINAELAPKFVPIIGEPDKEPEAHASLQEGFEVFDAMTNRNIALTPDQRMRLIAGVRYKAAAFDPLLKSFLSMKQRVVDLEARLAKAAGSEPPPVGDHPRALPAPSPDGTLPARHWEQEIDELAKMK